MADVFRFGSAERVLISIWMVMATAFMIAALSAAIPEPGATAETVVQWWARLGIATAFLLITAPWLRVAYRDLVAPRLPRLRPET